MICRIKDRKTISVALRLVFTGDISINTSINVVPRRSGVHQSCGII